MANSPSIAIVDGHAAPDHPPLPNSGFYLQLDQDEIEGINLRVLSHTAGLAERVSNRIGILVPREQTFELLFFRKIFIRLRDQVPQTNPNADPDENIPIEVFQRAFERLFYVLKDPQGFSAKVYDENRNGYVGWGEFCFVFKRRKVLIKLSLSERIYLMFDNQDSCHLAEVISIVVLLTIIASSLCFIFSTVPEYQTYPLDGSNPLPDKLFNYIEKGCLVLFVLEYVIRLATCWGVRAEVFDQVKLLDITTGYDVIKLPSPLRRLVTFIVAPSNIVDLAAILPGVVGVFFPIDGGGFVVLRLIRLTRIFRALKHIRGPAIVLARTIQSSLKAFFVLAFNLLLVIVISGSLMYLSEGGTWEPSTKTYQRNVGRFWNSTINNWQDGKEESPFLSIPHSFWWAIVTATTVGYGDVYPTTSFGYIIAVVTMVMSIVILALPVGVIGGSFSQNWENFERDEKATESGKAQETAAITSAMQKIDPSSMSSLMLIDVWNDRFPTESVQAWGDNQGMQAALPLSAEFMGHVVVELELPADRPIEKTLSRLVLKEDPNVVKRPVTGTVTIKYEWTPKPKKDIPQDFGSTESECGGSVIRPVHGSLKVTLVSAEKLINLDLHSLQSASNPFCTVLCYPFSPDAAGDILKPQIWRSPTWLNTLSPQWHASSNFDFCWTRPRPKTTTEPLPSLPPMARQHSDSKPVAPASSCDAKMDQALGMLRDLGSELKNLHDRVDFLRERVAPGGHGFAPPT